MSFRVVPKLTATARGPACLTCGVSHREGGFVDLAVAIEFEGHVYLCVACAAEVGAAVGMVSEQEADALGSMMSAQTDEVRALEARAEKAEDERDALARALDILGRDAEAHGLAVALAERADADPSQSFRTLNTEGSDKLPCPHAGCQRRFSSQGRLAQHVAAIHKEGNEE